MKLPDSTALSKEDQIELGRMLSRVVAEARGSGSTTADGAAQREINSIAWLARNDGIAASRPDRRVGVLPKTLKP